VVVAHQYVFQDSLVGTSKKYADIPTKFRHSSGVKLVDKKVNSV